MPTRTLSTLIALVLAVGGVAAAGEDVVLKAMEDELARSMTKLKMENLDPPYFVAYRVDDLAVRDVAATFGSLLRADERHARLLRVEVRVGEPALDNTNFLAMPSFSGSVERWLGIAELPLDDSYLEIRRQIWLATDAAYKRALEELSKKRAALQNKTRTDEVPDFSSEEAATVVTEDAPPPLPDEAAVTTLVRDLSAVFRDLDEVYTSTVSLQASSVRTRFLNSEGSRFVRVSPEVRFAATAQTQAPDGMPLSDFVAAYGRSLDELPDKDTLAADIRAMGERLAELRQAPLLDTYNGPVLFEGQAAAEVLAQAFVPRLLATRDPVSDNPQLEMFLKAQSTTPLVDKLGARVLPRQLALVDDPTATEVDGQPLYGGYPVDDDGVVAEPTEVVARGTLKTLLAARNPVKGVASSTGNRRGSGPAPSNLLLTTSDPMTDEELSEELRLLVEERELEYGVVVRRIGNPVVSAGSDPMAGILMMIMGGGGSDQSPVEPLVAAYKVYPDGREELLRNVQIGDLGVGAFKDIVGASESRTVTTMPYEVDDASPFGGMMFALGGGGQSAPLVSVATPSLLFEDLTLKKPSGEVPKPPLAGHPAFAGE